MHVVWPWITVLKNICSQVVCLLFYSVYQFVSVYISQSQYISQYRYLSVFSICQSVSVSISQYQYLSVSICQSVSISQYQYLSVSISIYQSVSVSVSVSIYQYISQYQYRYLSVSVSIYQYQWSLTANQVLLFPPPPVSSWMRRAMSSWQISVWARSRYLRRRRRSRSVGRWSTWRQRSSTGKVTAQPPTGGRTVY